MMTSVQLGWISSAINYVFNKVLSPLFSFFSDLLSDVFEWIFNNILGPLLEAAFSLIMQTIGKYVMRIVGRVLYNIESMILQVLDAFQHMFNVLAGTSPVSDSRSGLSGSLLSVIARSGYVTKAMVAVISISIVLTFFFAIIGTIKSIGDMGGPQSHSVGHVLRQLSYALLRMLTAPVLGLFIIVLGDAVLLSVTKAMTLGDNVTIARSLFVISTLDAVDDEFGTVDMNGKKYEGGFRITFSWGEHKSSYGDMDNEILGYNYSTRPDYLARHPDMAADYGLTDKFRKPFYTGAKDYSSSVDVDDVFNVGRIDYFVGILGSILFIFVLGSTLFTFTSRLFDVVLLLIIEPFFISPMPLDDGEHFKKWEDLFIGKIFSGYGMVVAMYLYLLICGMVFDGRIAFAKGTYSDILMDMIMRIILLLGGAATMMTAGPIVTSIISSAAAGEEAAAQQVGMQFTGKMMQYAAKPLKFALQKGMDQAFGDNAPELPGDDDEDKEDSFDEKKKDDAQQDKKEGEGSGSFSGGSGGGSGSGGSGSSGGGSGSGGSGGSGGSEGSGSFGGSGSGSQGTSKNDSSKQGSGKEQSNLSEIMGVSQNKSGSGKQDMKDLIGGSGQEEKIPGGGFDLGSQQFGGGLGEGGEGNQQFDGQAGGQKNDGYDDPFAAMDLDGIIEGFGSNGSGEQDKDDDQFAGVMDTSNIYLNDQGELGPDQGPGAGAFDDAVMDAVDDSHSGDKALESAINDSDSDIDD